MATDSHPLDNAHAERTYKKKAAAGKQSPFLVYYDHKQLLFLAGYLNLREIYCVC